jgi:hypothetical protein
MKLRLNDKNSELELSMPFCCIKSWKVILADSFVKKMSKMLVWGHDELIELEFSSKDGLIYTGSGYLQKNTIIGSGALVGAKKMEFDSMVI